MKAEYQQHPLSAAFPAMATQDLTELAEDIKQNGQHEQGVLYEGMILDGWHRYLACRQVGVSFRAWAYDGKDPAGFVKSKNWHRRHLSASQKAAAEVALNDWRPHGDQRSAAAADRPKSTAQMAKAAGVSERTIEQAKVAHKAGLSEEVRDGKISVERAAEIAKLPKAKREKALQGPKPQKPKVISANPKLEAEFRRLKEEFAELQEANSELALMAEAAKIHEGEEGYRKIKAVLAELESTKRERNRYMNECAELKKQVKHLQAKLDKGKK